MRRDVRHKNQTLYQLDKNGGPVDAVVEIKNVVKKYDQKPVVNGLTLEIHKGECFGFLGPNGAGKSTLMRMIYCASPVTSGEIYVLNLNVKKNQKEIKSKIGVVPQEDGLDSDFNVIENLKIFGSYYNIPEKELVLRSIELLREMKLDEYTHRHVETLSGGMKRRLAIARGMIQNPELVILDEPTAGLDPQARLWIWDFFKKQKENNKTIIVTTHYMEEAEIICDRIAVIDDGKILAIGKPSDLILEHIGIEVVEFEVKQNEVFYFLKKLKSLDFEVQSYGTKISIFIKKAQSSRAALDLVLSNNIQIRKASLNDVFLKLSGHQLRDEQ